MKELKLGGLDKENVPTREGQPDMPRLVTALPQKCDSITEMKQPVKVRLLIPPPKKKKSYSKVLSLVLSQILFGAVPRPLADVDGQSQAQASTSAATTVAAGFGGDEAKVDDSGAEYAD